MDRLPRVVIAGAGFAGLAAAHRLGGKAVAVTVVDRHNYHTFQPLLYQVATAGLEPADVAYPVRTIVRRAGNIGFRRGEIESFDLDARRVMLAGGASLPFDYLIVATGAVASFFGIPGAAEHALPLYTLDDARHLRNHLLASLDSVDPDGGGASPTFVIVGGGPTGVETAGALSELIDISVRHDKLPVDRAQTRVVLLDAADRLLTPFTPRASRYTLRQLRKRGVDVRLNTAVAEITDAGVRLKDGELLPADVVIWAAGVTGSGTVSGRLAGDAPHGRPAVLPTLALPGHPTVFVTGDAAAIGTAKGRPLPQVAQVAIQSGRHAADEILSAVAGAPGHDFAYHDKGIMATIGRRAAVAQLAGGLLLRGTVGWLAWLGLHLVYLIGFRNRLLVLLNWFWRYLNWPSGPRLIIGEDERTTVGRP